MFENELVAKQDTEYDLSITDNANIYGLPLKYWQSEKYKARLQWPHNQLNDTKQLTCFYYMADLPRVVCAEFLIWLQDDACVKWGYSHKITQEQREFTKTFVSEEGFEVCGTTTPINSTCVELLWYIAGEEWSKGWSKLSNSRKKPDDYIPTDALNNAGKVAKQVWLNECLAKFQELLADYEVRQQAKQSVAVASIEASPMVQQLSFM